PINALERAEASVNGLPDPLVPLHELNPGVPAEVSAVLEQALALRTDARPESAAAMRAALAALGQIPVAPAVGEEEPTVVVAQTPTPDEMPLEAITAAEPSAYVADQPTASMRELSDPLVEEPVTPDAIVRRPRSRWRWAIVSIMVLLLPLTAIPILRANS